MNKIVEIKKTISIFLVILMVAICIPTNVLAETAVVEDDETLVSYAPLNGKVISILGDSISTFEGYIPKADGFNLEHLARYPQDNLVTDVKETWWMQVIDSFDAKLGVNDSWRGTTVSGAEAVTSGSSGSLAAMSNLTRIQNLSSNGTPDVIMFYGGTNDLAHVSKVGSFDVNQAPEFVDLDTTSWDNLAEAYVHTLLRLKYYYPDAQIMAIFPAYTKSYYSDAKLAEANKVLAEICQHYKVPYVDLCGAGVTAEYLPDGIHPGAEGMDIITDAVVKSLLDNCSMEIGENVVYPVSHSLNNVKASLGYYKGVSAGKSFIEELSGDEVGDVKVTMDGEDITEKCFSAGVINIEAVSGPIEIVASAKESISDHLQQRPERICCASNLWQLLEHDDEYFYIDDWAVHSSGNVKSVTFSVNEGEKITASSFGKAGTNGGSMNGIRTTFFCEGGAVISKSPADVYAEYSANGYLTVPEGAIAINIPMWTASENWEINIASADHIFDNWQQVTEPTCDAEGQDKRTCAACGTVEMRDTRVVGENDKVLVSNKLPETFFEDKTIMCVGDSITAGTGVENDEKYYAVLGELLGAKTINRGTSGATMAPGGHLPNKYDTVMTKNYLKDVDVVTILLGVNDWNNGVKEGTFRGSLKYDPSATYYELGEFGTDDTTTIYGATKMWCERIVELKETESLKNTEFVFMTPVITCRNRSVTTADDWSAEKENVFGHTLREYCMAIMETCAYYDIPVLDLNMYSGMYYHNEDDNNVDYFGGDGIHPGANGHSMMAEAVAEFLLDNYSYENQSVKDNGHEYVEEVIEPTCIEKGYTKYRCICGYSYVGDYIDATGKHIYENGFCSQCGEEEPIIPENWCAVPISENENSETLAYKIEDGTLTFCDFGDPSTDGYGIMPDYTNGSISSSNFDIAPWYNSEQSIEKVIFDKSISHIGSYTLVNINEIRTIVIQNPQAETVRDAVLFNAEDRIVPLDIFAASTITTVNGWLRGSMNRPIIEVVPDVTMCLTDQAELAEELNELTTKLQTGKSVDGEKIYEVLVSYEELTKNKYSISNYSVDIANAEGCYELIKNYMSGACGEDANYELLPIEESGKLELVISGNGKMDQYSGKDTPWSSVMDSISDISVDESMELSSIEAFPADATFHININSKSYEFIKANGCDICFDELRVLLIGNSHTRNYSAFLSKILMDMNVAGLKTKVTIDKSITGSIGLYSGRNSNASGAYRSHLEGLEKKTGAYKKLSEEKYDLIIVQDYLESMVDTPEDFTEGIGSFIGKVKEITSENGMGSPEIAWFADWIDIRNTGGDSSVYDNNGASIKLHKLTREEGYAKSLDSIAAVEKAMAQDAANMPDFVIQGSTIKQNAMSSYLGQTKLWDMNRYCLLESDTTHLTGELGCYILGAGVMSVIASHYGDALTSLNGTLNVGTALTVENGPSLSGSGSQYEGAVNSDLLNVIREVVDSPYEFRQSIYTVDPVDDFENAINGIEWDTESVTDEASALAIANVKIDEVVNSKVDKATVTMQSYIDENNFVITVYLRHGYSVREVDVTVHNHTLIVDPAIAATCTESGLTEGSHCDVCGDIIVEQEVVEVLGHDCEEHDGKEATCTEAGWEVYETCSRCDYTTYKTILAKGHDIKKHVVDATCTEDGYTVKYCSCGYEETVPGEKATGHSFTNYEESIPAKCEKAGKEKAVCDNGCGAVDVRDIKATGHTEVIDKAVEATCTKTGLTEGSHCSVCDVIIVEQKVVEKLAHDTVKHEAKAATCTEKGWKAYETCSRCDHTTFEEIAALGHSEVIDEPIDATCTKTGLTEGKHCSVCGEVLIKQQVTEKLAHDTVKHEAKEATCIEKGYEAYETCNDCDYTTYKETDPLGHDIQMHEAKAPTCEEIGWEAYETCKREGCEYSTYEEIAALGHKYGEEKYKTPTENEDGGYYEECTECGDIKWNKKQTYEEYIEAGVNATSLKVTAEGVTKTETIKLSWTKDSDFEITYYNVFRSTTGEAGTFDYIGRSTSKSYEDKKAEVGKTYYYKVIGYHKVDEETTYKTKTSDAASAKIKKVTASEVKATPMYGTTSYLNKGLKIMWTSPNIKVDGYQIYRSTTKNGTYKKVKTTKSNVYSWNNTGLKVGKRYFYKIRGYKYVNGKTVYTKFSSKGFRYVISGAADVKMANSILRSDAITAKKAVKVSSGIKVTWSKETSSKCNRYSVWRATSKNGTYTKLGTTKNKYYTDKKAKKGKTYYYKIRGYRIIDSTSPTTNYSNVVSGKR